jgi:Domain of unknown function (DUF4268)
MTLGRLERVDLTFAWKNESTDFTPWLAKEENLDALSEALSMELEALGIEQYVGPYRADILCKDTFSGKNVLIENQLYKTDHTHLGQILTYAAGLNCKTVIWIASKFTEEHRAALDFLNEITEEDVSFFGVELELWRIGDSVAAPKFNIISRPNSWTKNLREAAQHAGELTNTKQNQLAYWTAFKEFMEERKSLVRCQKGLAQHWTNMSIGRSGFWLSARVNSQKNRIATDLHIKTQVTKHPYLALEGQRNAIDLEFGEGLEWNELSGSKESIISIVREDADFSEKDDWKSQFEWLATNLEKLVKVFRYRIKQIELE